MTFARLAMVFVVFCLVAAGQAKAQLPGENPFTNSQAVWLSMDKCKRQAFQKFPDYTPEGNAKREKAVRQCLEANNLPPLSSEPPSDGKGASGR